MTKRELINQVSAKTGLITPLSRIILDSFFEVVKASLTKGEDVHIRTFGSFLRKRRASKVARNISQNTAIKVAAQVLPAFKPSGEFTDHVRTRAATSLFEKSEL